MRSAVGVSPHPQPLSHALWERGVGANGCSPCCAFSLWARGVGAHGGAPCCAFPLARPSVEGDKGGEGNTARLPVHAHAEGNTPCLRDSVPNRCTLIPIARSEFMDCPPPAGSPRFARGTAWGAWVRFPLQAGGTLRRGVIGHTRFCELWLRDWYYWENEVSWESTKQLFGGMWAGFCADWQAAWAGDAQAFGRAFGGVLITVGTAAAPFARGGTAGTGVSTVGRGGARPVQVGQAGERAAGIPQGSKAQIRINGRTRIPDRLTQSELIEVKNVRKLSYTQQLQDFYEYCNRNNLRFVLVVRRDTQLSRTLQEMERRGQIVVRRILR